MKTNGRKLALTGLVLCGESQTRDSDHPGPRRGRLMGRKLIGI